MDLNQSESNLIKSRDFPSRPLVGNTNESQYIKSDLYLSGIVLDMSQVDLQYIHICLALTLVRITDLSGTYHRLIFLKQTFPPVNCTKADFRGVSGRTEVKLVSDLT